jgi:lipopolysaccharide biosynthesis protein
MRLISFYLPQFHEIPENNAAWGSGFTEWVNVKKSKPRFIGHSQPRIPLHNNYYNLLDKRVMYWQAKLANKAGIYGFCFYHYWFHGKMVLQKPVENLFNDKKIKLRYCFAWANEPWTRTWHGAGGNKEILIAQTYGKEEEWSRHYEYFRSFFMDERYIKEENKPILLIYRLRNIPHFNEMLRYWNKRAKQDGFSGIFFVSMNVCREHVEKSCWVDASVDFEPNRTKSEKLQTAPILKPREKGGRIWNYFAIKRLSYDKLNRAMQKKTHGKNQFRTVFVDYDDSPRRGALGVVIRGASPSKFGRYLKKTIKKSREEGNRYVFLNAWNEWGEGNYLEPDTRYGYEYLKQIKAALEDVRKGSLYQEKE